MAEKINSIPSAEEKALTKNYNPMNFLGLILPSIFTFIFIAIYQIVDGRFIGKYVGPYAIAAVNLYYPIISLLLSFGTMIGTGANAYMMELIGKGKKKEANDIFNQVIEVSLILSVVFSIVCLVFMNPIMKLLGATEGNIAYLQSYYLILTAFAPAILFQTIIGILVIGEGKTVLTGVLIIVGGVFNIVLDYVFMAVFKWGIMGAALATVIGYLVPILYAFIFYSKRGTSRYTFGFCTINLRHIGKILYNGSSEMVSNLSAGVTALMMNHIAFNLACEVGVSAVSVFLYVQFIVMAVFMGIATAAEPLFSFYYGKQDIPNTKKTFKLSMGWTVFFSVVMLVLIAVFSRQIASFFFEGDVSAKGFAELAERSVLLSAPAAIFVGLNILASGIFTAFGNGTVSAILSGVRTFVILVICLLIMPKILNTDGLWLSWTVAEALSLIVSIVFLGVYRKKYGY